MLSRLPKLKLIGLLYVLDACQVANKYTPCLSYCFDVLGSSILKTTINLKGTLTKCFLYLETGSFHGFSSEKHEEEGSMY